jgi:hypothetical protein
MHRFDLHVRWIIKMTQGPDTQQLPFSSSRKETDRISSEPLRIEHVDVLEQ